MPELSLPAGTGASSTSELLRSGEGILLDLTPEGRTGAPRQARVRLVRAPRAAGDGPARVLLRPDGHVAWADGTDAELEAALRRWFGEPAQSLNRSDEELRTS
jgi:hypothetical protein